MRKFFTSFVAASLALSTVSPAFAATIRVGGAVMTADRTIMGNISKASTLRTLVSAVNAADLDTVLAGTGPFTVFAPTDAAFRPLKKKIDMLMDGEHDPELATLLTNHVVPGRYMAADLKDGMTLTTVQGEKLAIKRIGRNIWVNNARVQIRDVMASNGVAHIINKVLMPTAQPVVKPASSSSSSKSSVLSSSSSSATSSPASSSSSVSSTSPGAVSSSSRASTAWVKSTTGLWQDKAGRWLKVDNAMVKFKTTEGNWVPLANWQWQAENGMWYTFDSSWHLWVSADGVKWADVAAQHWPGKMGYWYKITDGLWWMSDGSWTMVPGNLWQDMKGDWYKVAEGRLMMSANGTLWAEAPNWQWRGTDGSWYRFDSKWGLWMSANGTTWSEVPSMTWMGKDGAVLMLDSEGMVWMKS